MAVLYLTRPGTSLGAESRTFVLRRDGRVLERAPALDVENIVVLGPAHLTSDALRLCYERSIELVVASHGCRAVSRLGASETGLRLRAAQYRRFDDVDFAQRMAQAIVTAKLVNSRYLLARGRTGESLKRVLPLLDRVLHLVTNGTSVDRLRGLEGRGSAIHFSGLRDRFNPEFGFKGRNRRPPRDPANAMLSFAYTLLTAEATAAVAAAGLEPALGFLHRPRNGRPALALDLVEQFRAPVADSLCLRVSGLRIVQPSDFRMIDGGVIMSPAARRRFIAAFEQKLVAPLKHAGPVSCLRESIRAQAQQLARCVQTGEDYHGYRHRA
jgi:CRISPR-associated protein Cas1